MDVQLKLQMGRFSVHFQYFYHFVGVIAGAWRRLVSGCSFCGVLWESGKRNMDLTTVFSVPNAHHVFGSRTGFSDSEVPSGVSFGGCWIGFWCLLEPWRRRHGSNFTRERLNLRSMYWKGYGKAVCTMGVPGQLMSQMASRAKARILHP